MIEENGKVISKQGKQVWVSTLRKTACGSCEAKNACGQSALSKLLSPEANHVLAIDPIGVEIGDHVVIGIPEDIVLKSSLLMYLLPLLALIVGAVMANFLPFSSVNPDLLAGIGGIVGFLLGLALVKWHGSKNRNNESYQPTVLREQINPLAHPISIQ